MKRVNKGKKVARAKVAPPTARVPVAVSTPAPPPVEAYDVLSARAQDAQDKTAWADAALLWALVRDAYPDVLPPYQQALICLEQAGLPDAREALFGEAAAHFVDQQNFSREHAWIAHHRRDWTAALARWQVYAARFPGALHPFLGRASTLAAAGKGIEADVCIEAGLKLYPNNRELLAGYAIQARDGGDYPTACARWARVREILPDEPIGYWLGGWCLRDAGYPIDANQVFKAGAARFPSLEKLVREHSALTV